MISLKRDFKRRIEMQERFPNHYSRFNIIDAIDMAQQLEVNIDSTFQIKTDYKSKKPLTLGEKCCAISHLNALQKLVNSDEDYCIVIEDDLIGGDLDFDNLSLLVSEILKQSDESITILGGQQGLKNSKYLSGYRLSRNLWEIPKISQDFITRACCYLITKKAAIKVINYQSNKLVRSDQWKELCNGQIKLYYSDLFRHPTNLSNSRLERDRKLNSIISRVLSDGIVKLLNRNIIKIYIRLLQYSLMIENVTIKSNK